jgi:hypothetical protein
MASPLSADALLAALRAESVTVHEVDGWRTHNRNARGAWGPVNGVMIHHTVTDPGDDVVSLICNGHSELPGPLATGCITKNGVVHLTANGRANHAGGGDPDVLTTVVNESYGDYPPATHEHQGSAGAVDGNAHFYGWECENLGDGKDPWPRVQYTAIVKATAGICRAHGWGAKSAIGHLEWSDWKPDPRGFDMKDFRRDLAACLALPAGVWGTVEEDTMPTAEEIAKAVWDHGISNRFRPGADGKPRVIPARYYQEWSDSHFDDLMTAIRQAPAPALTPDQLAELAARVAATPGLAAAIAEQVATKLATRLAE